MKQNIKELKQLKIQKDALMNNLLELQLEERRLLDLIQQCRQKQGKAGHDIEMINKRVFDMIGEL